MKIYTSRLNAFVFVFLLAGIALTLFLGTFQKGKLSLSQNVATRQAQAMTAEYLTLSAPTPTYTETPTLTATPSPTITPTFTPLPTATSTPPIAPCLVRLESVAPVIYRFPSFDQQGATSLPKPAEVYVYYKLADEPWWSASPAALSQGEGWVYAQDIVANECIQGLPTNAGLETLPENTVQTVYQDTFADYRFNWTAGENRTNGVDGTQLQFLSLNLQAANLKDQTLKGENTIWISFQREPSSRDDYVGIRLASEKISGTYLELRIFADCRYQYLFYLDGSSKETTPANPIGVAKCTPASSSLLRLHTSYDLYQSKIHLSGDFAGYALPQFSINDSKQYLSSLMLTMLSNGRSFFNYTLITTP